MPKKSKDECSHCTHPDFEYIDLFETPGARLVDTHLDTDLSEDELARRLLDAAENAKYFGASAGINLESEIGELLRPSLRWQDFIRHISQQKRNQGTKFDWNAFRVRPLFAGLYLPKRKNHPIRILIALDTSASITKDQATYGISQCQVIDHRGEAIVVCWDTEVKWKEASSLKKINSETLQGIKLIGGGGTNPISLFTDYEKEIGKVDLIVVITDGIFDWGSLRRVRLDKNVDVCWILTINNPGFRPDFGRVFHLHNDR